jgi:acyl-CoA dehydrogenase
MIFEGTSEIQRLVIGRTLGDAATEPPLHHHHPVRGAGLARSLGRGGTRRGRIGVRALRATRRIPRAALRPAMRVLSPPKRAQRRGN